MGQSGGGEPKVMRTDQETRGGQVGSKLGMNSGRRQVNGKKREAFEESFDQGRPAGLGLAIKGSMDAVEKLAGRHHGKKNVFGFPAGKLAV